MIKTRAKVLNQLKTVKSFACTCGFVLSFLSTLFVFISLSFADPNIAASSSSSTCKNSTLETYSGTSNLSANWGANTINLHWYADENATTELTGSGIPTSCVYDGALTPPPVSSIPQKTGYTFAGWKVRGLPDGYTKLQYIQSSGTQYISTGITVSSGVSVKAVIEGGQGDNGVVFSFDQDYTGSFVKEYNNLFCGAGKCFEPSNRKTIVYSSWTGNSGSITQTVEINGVSKSYTSSRGYSILDIFRGRNWNAADSFWVGKIYGFSMYKNGKAILNLVPAKNSNNVVGMYDTVTKTFFTNSGTGSFTAGPVVQ